MKKVLVMLFEALGLFKGLEPTGIHVKVITESQIVVIIKFGHINFIEKELADVILIKINKLENVINADFVDNYIVIVFKY